MQARFLHRFRLPDVLRSPPEKLQQLVKHLLDALRSASSKVRRRIQGANYRRRLYVILGLAIIFTYFLTDIDPRDTDFFENIFAEIIGATLTFMLVDLVLERGKKDEAKPARVALLRDIQRLSASVQNAIGQLVARLHVIPSTNILNEFGSSDYDYAYYIPRLSEEERRLLPEDPLVSTLSYIQTQCDRLLRRHTAHIPPSLVPLVQQLEELPSFGHVRLIQDTLLSQDNPEYPWQRWLIITGQTMKEMCETFDGFFQEVSRLEEGERFAFRQVHGGQQSAKMQALSDKLGELRKLSGMMQSLTDPPRYLIVTIRSDATGHIKVEDVIELEDRMVRAGGQVIVVS
jgi:hypothetical protein